MTWKELLQRIASMPTSLLDQEIMALIETQDMRMITAEIVGLDGTDTESPFIVGNEDSA